MHKHLRGLADALAAVVFPAPCRVCERTLGHASRIPVCPDCLAAIEPLEEPVCGRCGRPLVSRAVREGGAAPLCHLCRRGAYDFDFARSYAAYTPEAASAVILLKYHEVTPLGEWFARRLREVAARHAEYAGAQVVVPVPLHPGRLRERGYNQAELIARPLARALGLPCRSYLLVRTKPRPDRLRLTRRERWTTVRGAYAVREGTQVDNLGVLLVDDVFTTGATLDACSRALRGAGVSRVVALTAARTVFRGERPGMAPAPEGPKDEPR